MRLELAAAWLEKWNADLCDMTAAAVQVRAQAPHPVLQASTCSSLAILACQYLLPTAVAAQPHRIFVMRVHHMQGSIAIDLSLTGTSRGCQLAAGNSYMCSPEYGTIRNRDYVASGRVCRCRCPKQLRRTIPGEAPATRRGSCLKLVNISGADLCGHWAKTRRMAVRITQLHST